MSTSYGCTLTFGATTYGVEGLSSPFRARLFVYRQAYEDGNYTIPTLREKWWQFWRPTEYSQRESYVESHARRRPLPFLWRRKE